MVKDATSSADLFAMLPSATEFVEMMGDSHELALEIVLTAQREISAVLPEVNNVLERGDAGQLGKILHSIRGSSSTLGAEGLPGYIRNIEDSLNERPLSGSWNFMPSELLQRLEEYLQALRVLEAELRALPPSI